MADERLLTLDEILAGDCELNGPSGKSKLVHSPIGNLVLPTGRIVTRDATTGASAAALVVTVAPGSYPASVCKEVGNPKHRGACFLIVRFSTQRPVKWEQAGVPGEDASKLGIGARLGFSVKGLVLGTVGVVDESVQDRLSDAAIVEAIDTSVSGSIVLDPQTGATLVVTKARGDSFYGSYWGFDETGRPVALVTDLNRASFARPSALDAAAVQERIRNVAAVLLAATNRKAPDQRPGEATQLAALRELEALGGPEARKLAPLAELSIFESASESMRISVPRVLGRLANEDALLREDYRRLILTGDPPPRVACGVAVAQWITWTERDADVGQALLHLVETATEPRLLGELIAALPSVRHLLPDGEVERRLEQFLQHAHEGLRSRALRQLMDQYWEIRTFRGRPPTREDGQRLLASAVAASADPSVAVRVAASQAMRQVLLAQPAHHGRLLWPLRDPSPVVAYETATELAGFRAEWAEDVFAPVAQCIPRLARDERLPEAMRAELRSAHALCSQPPTPTVRSGSPIFAAAPVELRHVSPGRLRLTSGEQTLFDVETRRIFEVSTRPADAARSWLLLGGCFKPYRFERVNGTRIAVGPLSNEHAAELVKRLSSQLALPASPVFVPFDELQRTPAAFHGMFLETDGEWQLAPDVSAFGKVWLSEPNGFVKPAKFGNFRVRVSGIWHAFPRPNTVNVGPPGGYGHMAMWPAELEAYTMTVVG